MDPVSGSLILKAAGAAFTGVQAFSAAKAEKQNAETNAFIGRTRAMQTDTSARQGLTSELATMRNVLAANGQAAGVSTFEIFKDLRSSRDRERRVAFSNEMSRVHDFNQQGANAMSRGRAGLLVGLANAGPSMFDLYQRRQALG